MSATARATALDYAQFDPFWLEEPVAPLDYEGHRLLRSEVPYPIATGENLYTLDGFRPLLERDACDYVMPDVARCGGLGQTIDVCREALSCGVVPSPHVFGSGISLAATLHLMAALPGTQLLEFDPSGTSLHNEVFVDPLIVEDGEVVVPTAPGLGVQLPQELTGR